MSFIKRISLFATIASMSLPVFSAGSLPSVLEAYYQPTVDSEKQPVWLRKDNAGYIYRLCLDSPTDAKEHIVVMCADGESDRATGGASIGYFDLWFLNNGKIVSAETVESHGIYGTSGIADTVYLGKHRGIVTESIITKMGEDIVFQDFYLPAERHRVKKIAAIMAHYDNKPGCVEDRDCVVNYLDSDVEFAYENEDESSGSYPKMYIHSFGVWQGKIINERAIVPFDISTGKYPVPDSVPRLIN